MPQVNEISWIFLSSQIFILLIVFCLSLSYLIFSSKTSYTKFNLIYYSCLI